MSRPFRTTTAILFILSALNFAGCKTIYSDTYAPKRNHFIALKETPKDKDLLPATLPSAPSGDTPPAPVAPAPAPAPDAMAPAPAPAPAPGAVPGL